MAAAPLLATASSGGSHFAAITVAGVVPAPPEVVFRMLEDPARHAVFKDVKSVREIGRSGLRLQGPHLLSEVEVEQVARVHMLRMPVDAAMTVRLACNHSLRQVRLQLTKGNSLVRKYDGLYTVLPFSHDGGPQPLPEGLADALRDQLGPDCWQQLERKLEAAGHAVQPAGRSSSCGTSGGGTRSASRPSRCQQTKQVTPPAASCTLAVAGARRHGGLRAQHSLVILHQKLQPALRPPPGLGGFVRGQVRRQFERMFGDLHLACQQATAARPAITAAQGLADILSSFLLPTLRL